MSSLKHIFACFILGLALPLKAQMSTPETQWQGSTACNYPVPLPEVIYNYTQTLGQQAPLINKTVNGLAFTQESKQLINFFERLTRHATVKDLAPAKAQKCDKVMCALEAMFAERTEQYELSDKDADGKVVKQSISKQVGGKLMAHTMVFILGKYNVNVGHLSDPRKESSLMSESEVNEILMGLRFFPKKTFPLYNKELFISHYLRGKIRANSNADGRFYGAGELGNESRDRIEFRRDTGSATHLLHELGHHIDASSVGRAPFGSAGFCYSSAWLSYSGGWIGNKPGDYNAFPRWDDETGSDIYGATGPNEDFAEAVAFYRIDPLKLWRASANKYNFIKKHVYQGVEFLNNQQCSAAVDVPAHVSPDYQAPERGSSVELSFENHPGVQNDCKVIGPDEPHYFTGRCDPKYPYFVSNRTATDWAENSCYKTYASAVAHMLKDIPLCQVPVGEQELQTKVQRLEQMIATGAQGTCEVKEYDYCPENYKWTVMQAETPLTKSCFATRNQAIGDMFKNCP